MLIIDWNQITETEVVPPFGTDLTAHLIRLHGAVKQASCSAWNLLYRVITDNNLPVGTVAFTDTGKPYFKDNEIYFSLSHSHGLCAVAISDHPVGVDVEIIKSSYNLHLIERSLCEEENLNYDGDFTRIWCRKEAVAKMIGKGIVGYPDYINTTNYDFYEERIEYNDQQYWLVVVG